MKCVGIWLALFVASSTQAARDCGLTQNEWRNVPLAELAQAKQVLGLAPLYLWFFQNPATIPRRPVFNIQALEANQAFVEFKGGPLLTGAFKSMGLRLANFEVGNPETVGRLREITDELLATFGTVPPVGPAKETLFSTLASVFDPAVMPPDSFVLFLSKPGKPSALVLLSVGYRGTEIAEPPMTAALVLSVAR